MRDPVMDPVLLRANGFKKMVPLFGIVSNIFSLWAVLGLFGGRPAMAATACGGNSCSSIHVSCLTSSWPPRASQPFEDTAVYTKRISSAIISVGTRPQFEASNVFFFKRDVESAKVFENMGFAMQFKTLKEELLSQFLLSQSLMSHQDHLRFRALSNRFVEAGWKFVIDFTTSTLDTAAHFSVSSGGIFEIRIPYQHLIASKYAGESSKAHNLQTLIHELQHYSTFERQIRNLGKHGYDRSAALIYLSSLKPISFARFVGQLEAEARRAEGRLPIEDQGLNKAAYVEAETLQRYVNALNGSALKSLEIDRAFLLQVDALWGSVVNYLKAQHGKTKRPTMVELYIDIAFRTPAKSIDQIERRNGFLQFLSGHAVDGIKGRMNEAALPLVKKIVLDRAQFREREIYQTLRLLATERDSQTRP